jgi:hypothetical protein
MEIGGRVRRNEADGVVLRRSAITLPCYEPDDQADAEYDRGDANGRLTKSFACQECHSLALSTRKASAAWIGPGSVCPERD